MPDPLEVKATEVEELPGWFLEHERLQNERFKRGRKDMRGIHKRLDNMPSSKDLKEVTDMLQNMRVGVSIIKISSTTLIRLAVICGAILGIAKFWREIVAIITRA